MSPPARTARCETCLSKAEKALADKDDRQAIIQDSNLCGRCKSELALGQISSAESHQNASTIPGPRTVGASSDECVVSAKCSVPCSSANLLHNDSRLEKWDTPHNVGESHPQETSCKAGFSGPASAIPGPRTVGASSDECVVSAKCSVPNLSADLLHNVSRLEKPETPHNVGESQLEHFPEFCENSDGTDFNSYKFPRPRVYVKNDFKSDSIPILDHLKFISENVGPKGRTPVYNDFIDRQLQISNPKKGKKSGQPKEVYMNSMNIPTSALKLVQFSIGEQPIKALVDTGSSHCLLSVNTYQKLSGMVFTKLEIDMRVAGSVLHNNVIGSTPVVVTFQSEKGEVEIPHTFLIAHNINGYEAILGSTILMDEMVVLGLTPTHLCLSEEYGGTSVALETATKRVQGNFMQCEETYIPKGVTSIVTAKVNPPLSCVAGSRLETTALSGSVSILECIAGSPDTVKCTVTNHSEGPLRLNPGDEFGLVYDLCQPNQVEDVQINSVDLPTTAGFSERDPEPESIDEQIISEHQIIDPSDLGKKFSYQDCEVNPNLDPDLRKRLDNILQEYQSVFAKSKLDVGEFKGFSVQLQIVADIPAEKQRFMSEEKMTYCNTTFDEFLDKGLVEEVHSPRTISNLLLVPKYEGLRDLTKASVYLAQVRGEKNSSFRIVQDLRRVNAKTLNVKKALPKLPEFIFQKLKNKVVSTVDANQAYWHLTLAPQSRSYTAFYLQGRTLQFCRMPQGLTSAPGCWDRAMSMIFSSETMRQVKEKHLTQAEADQLPESFEDFFDYYQDDSWIFSDDNESHLIHLKAVLAAYLIHDIRLSPKKSAFFPESFKILGVSLTPQASELSLDKVKALSILEWEKPDSLYTLQSRLYALNYWMKFIPALAEIKFPLQQIVRSQIFSWNEEADLAWQRIKALIALDVRLTIPERDEQLLITTDASKIACSCILWVHRKGSLRVVGCYSKLFSHTDSLKSIHFKETYALVLAFDHFKPYLLNTHKSVIVFTDARALMWVGRNREYSIACNGLVNKLAKIQLEIPHVVYSVPSEVNFLADVFSRAFSTSRFLEKAQFALSKVQANSLPPLTEPFMASEEALYRYFSLPLTPEESDKYPRKKSKISIPRPISNLYKLFIDCTPEEKYLSALRLLKGWDDSSIVGEKSAELNSSTLNGLSELTSSSDCKTGQILENSKVSGPLKPFEVMEVKRPDLHRLYTERVVEKTLNHLYEGVDPAMRARVANTLRENAKALYQQKLDEVMRDDFVRFEVMKELVLKNAPSSLEDSPEITIGYVLVPPHSCHPQKMDDRPGLDIPIQEDVVIHPKSQLKVDTGIKMVIPDHLRARIIPHSSVSSPVKIHFHSGLKDDTYSSTLKLILQNDSLSEVRMTAGTYIVSALILPITHPTLNFENGVPCHFKVDKRNCDEVHCMSVQMGTLSSPHCQRDDSEPNEDECGSVHITSAFGSPGTSAEIKPFQLMCLPTSYLHMMMDDKFPQYFNVPEMNLAIRLPEGKESKSSIMAELSLMESQMMQDEGECNVSLVYHPCPNPEAVIQDFTQELRKLSVQTQTESSGQDQSSLEKAKDWAQNNMCEKLAVISVDLLKNQSMTRTMLAQTQQGDDYLSTLREKVANKDMSFPYSNFLLKDQVLYKKCMSKHLKDVKHVICLPDVLLPAVIHFLHVNLGHSSFTITRRNFEHYYYNRNATRAIKSYVQACVTCALAQKFDIHKATPETSRTLEPTRPRQYLYCDVIPMQKGSMSYILFCLDAYSQYVYAFPLKDKKSASILQGLLCLFSATGWPEAIYLDNETSFQKAAKQLVKMAPVKVLYSVPYCQFQNWSENYIKSFKKTLLKVLSDAEHPHENEEWHIILPTVTQALNRQIIPDIGLTREQIHFNMSAHFHPLAHLDSKAGREMDEELNLHAANWFKIILDKRRRRRVGSKKSQIPNFHETQIVFMRDQAPAISSILKVPNKGPYRIEKLEERNVTLTDLATGKTVHSHVQFVRPMDLAEYRLLLSKGWDLNAQLQKAGQTVTHPGIFDAPSHPITSERVGEIEKGLDSALEEGDLETLFQAPVVNEAEPSSVDAPPQDVLMPLASRPPDIDLHGPPKPLRRSPRFNLEKDEDETDFNCSQLEIVSLENDLGEQTFSSHAKDVFTDVSKLYRVKLAAEKGENDSSFSLWENTEEENLCPKPVLKPKRVISFCLPAPPLILFQEKEE